MSHFRTFELGYDNLVKAIYEIALPLMWTVTILYWGAYYTPGLLNWSNMNTWVYPLYMHVVPVVTLTIEAIFNSVIFDIQKGAWRSLWLITAYLPLSYFSNDIVGYFPYSFVNYEDYMSYVWLGIVVGLQQGLFYGIGYLNNYLKGQAQLSPAQFFSYHANEIKNLAQLAGF